MASNDDSPALQESISLQVSSGDRHSEIARRINIAGLFQRHPPYTGVNPAVLEKIKHAAANFEDHQRYVVLLHDEITIKSNLVFDRRAEEVIGFINPPNWEV